MDRLMGIYKQLETEFGNEIAEEFIDHFETMVEMIEPSVIGLQSEVMYEQSSNGLFRIVHNLKSSSAFLQLKTLNKFSTFVEEILEQIRTSGHVQDEKVVVWLMMVNDQYQGWYTNLATDTEKWNKINYTIFNSPEEFINT
jgi:chemotaxis protein histidine kinase CheA